MAGYLKVTRNEELTALAVKHPNAFILLYFIALRARRAPSSVMGLDICESFLGDYEALGMTRAKYRRALEVLQKYKIVAIKATNKGTIVKLLDKQYYDINEKEDSQQSDHQVAIKKPSNSHQIATNKNVIKKELKMKEKKEEEETNATAVAISPKKQISEEAKELTQYLWQRIQANNEYAKEPNLEKWAEEMDKILRIDKRDLKAIRFLIEWSQQDSFWSTNILSPAKLRKHFEKLFLNARQEWQKKEKNRIPSFD